ncbi:Ribonuclease E [Moraxella catarrhalis]|nr:Ribonuclease E [Moraxella catarrhalis]
MRGETLHKTEEKVEKLDKADKPIRADKPKSEKTEKLPHQKAANSKEVVLHVSSIKAAENNAQVIHLSLDGSKSTKPTKDEPADTKDDAKIAPQANSNQAIKAQKEPAPAKPKHESEPIAQSDEIGTSHTASATTGVESKLAQKIQTLAKSMNKATNDPRVVQIALQQTQAINLNAITAGTLILRVLGESATGNFVNDFITAITKMSTPSQFDFANFGYSPLDTATKNEFGKLTQATAQVSAPQGRTEAVPHPITRRAANDPRGQHPEYIEATSPNNEQVSKTIAQHSNQASPDTSDHAITPADTKHKESKTVADSSSDSDNSRLSKADDAVEHLIDDTIDATTLAVEQISDSIGDTVGKTMANISTVVSEAADDTAKMADLDTHNQVKPESGKDKKVSQIKEITADQKTERRTKANSYKDMIESVAGQLQPQVGILNLMATKPTKASKPAKTRAPRKPSKKPTKVEVRKLSKPVESSPAKSADDSTNN